MEQLSKTPGVGFAKVCDPSGDSSTFLNLMLPDTGSAKRAVEEFKAAGVAGFDYWFVNMYHFINQWDHIKNLQTVSKLPVQTLPPVQDYKNLQLPKTQEVIGRLISFGVSCKWTEDDMKALASKISACVIKALKPVNA